MKLNFVCIGAQKAGTTTLHDLLKQHPDIFLPDEKEAHFFDVNELYGLGRDYYSTYFSNYNGEKIIGNINPNLQLDTRSIDRIMSDYGPDVKVIFILRNPVERAYSHYLMSKQRSYEDLDFHVALEREKERIKNPKIHKGYYSKELGHFEKNHLGYIYRSKYSNIIKYLSSKLPAENIKIILFEEFIQNKQQSLAEVLKFLGVENYNQLNLNQLSNPASKAKFAFFNKFLNQGSIIKDILKWLIPEGPRKAVKGLALDKNRQFLIRDQAVLSVADYKFYQKKYFDGEIKLLEKILKRPLDIWRFKN